MFFRGRFKRGVFGCGWVLVPLQTLINTRGKGGEGGERRERGTGRTQNRPSDRENAPARQINKPGRTFNQPRDPVLKKKKGRQYLIGKGN